MGEPTRSDLRAVAALMWLTGRVEQKEQVESESGGRPYRFAAWLALRLLVEAVPPDERLQAIDQALMFGDPQILERGPMVQAVETWSGEDADSFLTELAEIAVEGARQAFLARPQRLAEFRRHLQVSGDTDRLRLAEPGIVSAQTRVDR